MDNLKVLGISMEIKLQNKYRLITLTNDLNKKDIGIVLPKDDINWKDTVLAAARILSTKVQYSSKTVFQEFHLALDHIAEIRAQGDTKHGVDSWLDADNPSMEPKADYASRCRHAAKDYAGVRKDDESGCYHIGHEVTRGLMRLERLLRGIDDE